VAFNLGSASYTVDLDAKDFKKGLDDVEKGANTAASRGVRSFDKLSASIITLNQFLGLAQKSLNVMLSTLQSIFGFDFSQLAAAGAVQAERAQTLTQAAAQTGVSTDTLQGLFALGMEINRTPEALTVRINRMNKEFLKAEEQLDQFTQAVDDATRATLELPRLPESVFGGMNQEQIEAEARRLAEIRVRETQGLGDAVQFFGDIGIDEETLRSLQTGEERLRAIANALADIEDPAERATAAMRLLGEEAGPQIASELLEGEKAIDSWIAKAKEFNTFLSEEMIVTLLDLESAITDATMATEGIVVRFGEATAAGGIVADGYDRVADASKRMGDNVTESSDSISLFSAALQNTRAALQETVNAIVDLTRGDISSAFMEGAIAAGEFTLALRQVDQALTQMGGKQVKVDINAEDIEETETLLNILSTLLDELNRRQVTITIDADTSRAEQAIETLEGRLLGIEDRTTTTTLSAPRDLDLIPFETFQTGGVFRSSTPGGSGLALLHDQETVIPAGAAMGNVTFNNTFIIEGGDPNDVEEALANILDRQRFELGRGIQSVI